MGQIGESEFQTIIYEYNDYLLQLSYLYVKEWNTAEDIVQEVFINYWLKSNEFKGNSSIKTYLTRITINKCKDYLKSWRYRTHTLTNAFTVFIRQKNRLILHDEQLIVAEAVFALPIKLREVIVLYYYNELSIIEISNIINTSASTIKYRLKTAKERLRKMLSTQQWEVLINE
ncbi:sigma-70 family RNA polymerase sigma factor [Cytobacillus praedii]|uniref:sigma-70 family RNA polymerase sigma factor n=1 Tax=Cytobacillus praedii TaxID=1742358 RepID=UPI002E1B0646|nr:sigma-70 family RNA polymerase sigma factor [Cytobacillus praedii]